jgi:hypothetical protein
MPKSLKSQKKKGGAHDDCYDEKIQNIVREIVCTPETKNDVITKYKIKQALLKYHPDTTTKSLKEDVKYNDKIHALTAIKNCFDDTRYELKCTPEHNNKQAPVLKRKNIPDCDHPYKLDYIRAILKKKDNSDQRTLTDEGFWIQFYNEIDVEEITEEDIKALLTDPNYINYPIFNESTGEPRTARIEEEIVKVLLIKDEILKCFENDPSYQIRCPMTLTEINEYYYEKYKKHKLQKGDLSGPERLYKGTQNIGANILVDSVKTRVSHTMNLNQEQILFNLFNCHTDKLFVELGENIKTMSELGNYIQAIRIIDMYILHGFRDVYFKSFDDITELKRVRQLIIDGFNKNLKTRSITNTHTVLSELHRLLDIFMKDDAQSIQDLEKLGKNAAVEYQLNTTDFVKLVKTALKHKKFTIYNSSVQDRYRLTSSISIINPIKYLTGTLIDNDKDIYIHLINGWNKGIDELIENIKAYAYLGVGMRFKIDNVEQEKLNLETFKEMNGGRKKRSTKIK